MAVALTAEAWTVTERTPPLPFAVSVLIFNVSIAWIGLDGICGLVLVQFKMHMAAQFLTISIILGTIYGLFL